MTVALTYHAIPPAPTSYSYDVAEPQLRAHLQAAAAAGLNPQVTFDDGDSTQEAAALRVLDDLGLKATFFITLGWTGTDPRYMGWESLERLATRGHRLGLHGWSHLLLTSCTDVQLSEEIAEPRRMLQEKLGIIAEAISMPGGRWNHRVLKACADAGYRTVFTSDSWRDPFEFAGMKVHGRMNVTSKMSPEQLVNAIRNVRSPQKRIIGHTKAALQRVLGDAGYHRLWSWVNAYPDQEPGRTGY